MIELKYLLIIMKNIYLFLKRSLIINYCLNLLLPISSLTIKDISFLNYQIFR